MFSKILVTLGVILVCLWVLAAKRKAREQPVKTLPNPQNESFNKTLQRSSIVFMVVMVLAAGSMIFVEVIDQGEIMTVHVINTQTGDRISYQARKEDIQSTEFTTIHGRRIFVAGIERVEVEAVD